MSNETVVELVNSDKEALDQHFEKFRKGRVGNTVVRKGFQEAFMKILSGGIKKSITTESISSTASTVAELNFDPAMKHVYPVQTPWANGGLFGEVGGQKGLTREYWLMLNPNSNFSSGAAPQMSASYAFGATSGQGLGSFLKASTTKQTATFSKLAPMTGVTNEEARQSGALNMFVQRQIASLSAAKVMEEQNMLFAWQDAIVRPASVTGTGGTTGGGLSDGTYVVSVSALNYWAYKKMYYDATTGAGSISALASNARFGETQVRASANVVLAAGTAVQKITATWAKTTGAFAYAVYLTLSGTQYLVAIVGHNAFVATALTFVNGNSISGAAIAPTADASALDTDGQTVTYNGFHKQLFNSDMPAIYTDLASGGLTAQSGGTGVAQLDAQLEQLYRLGVSPEYLTVPSLDWSGWQAALMNTSSTNYRLMVETEDGTKIAAGQVINKIKNPYSGDLIDVIVHPLMAPGKSYLYTRDLPFQQNNTGVNLSHFYNIRFLQKIFAMVGDYADPGPWANQTIGAPILTYPSACAVMENIYFSNSF